MIRVLAVDCGGTRSTALLVEGTELIAEREGPATNLQVAGSDGVAQVVAELLEQLPAAEAVVLSVAGLRTSDERQRLFAAIRRHSITLPLAAYPDTHAALRASEEQQGIVLVSGTGSSAYARGRDGEEARAGGWGHLLGDEGSGYWICRALLQRVLRAGDEGDPQLAAAQRAVMEHYSWNDVSDARALALEPDAKRRIASLLPVAATLWRDGLRDMEVIILRAADELARLVTLAGRGVELDRPATVVLAGGVFRALPELSTMLQERLGSERRVSTLQVSPAWGALALARDTGAWEVAAEVPAPLTEAANSRSQEIDTVDTLAMLRIMNEEDTRVAPAVGRALQALTRLVEEAAGRLARGGRLVYVGAGTSGRLAVMDAVECVPTFGTEPGQVVALMAGGPAALTSAVEGAEDDAGAGAEGVSELRISDLDVVVGVSASGGAEFVRAALRSARDRGAFTAFLTCNPVADFSGLADLAVAVDVGPEVIAGSTRLKAGTAQKLMLNMISTGTMVRLGRTLGNRMVRMRPTNRKLRLRAVDLVSRLAGVGGEVAEQALEAANWDVGEAALAIRLGSPEAARKAAEEAGDLKEALLAAGIDAAET